MAAAPEKSASIKQASERSAIPERLRVPVPDFRNLGAVLRVLLVGNVLMLITVLIRAPALAEIGQTLLMMAGRVELPLILFATALFVLGHWLSHLNWRDLTLTVASLALASTIFCQSWILLPVNADGYLRGMIWALASSICVMAYFRWRQIAQMPALGEARILALTARIRPHFFFNSINGVLGVIRSDPKRAEEALESMAELFRELMRDSRELVTLCDEIELCNRYLELERLRLGERLKVKWELKHAPLNAQVPPLMLQPLIENAVFHGIEPNPEPGQILIRIVRRGNMLDMRISNPAHKVERRATGNRMAMNNIRERLTLFFDLEATLTTEETDGEFRVRVRIPLRREEK
ncbi:MULTISPECIES: sensor histidine kinase [unclassified Uliginosibacterium]|uniref:sensor histidine kinase n=1 Tax=unclassified Uliginosibacterium TaxID=2621521 RepID=UPI000C7E785F|nr:MULTISPECIES: histidine kinase [unclassified Uliginosibacterium]MDO6386129.1 histidine kinase [Uliginosibacterium sp. 31-12]PLK49195.1 sensor histidine kinase [Uliginosibacterium sp. TH139]